ncbi:hypothetical protein Xoosp13_259 [Xanthomonas phage Xoo-sp13]|nr:hypothetical protein Xoosp13_259 [Xanthomonas phage Xoo-sp13]
MSELNSRASLLSAKYIRQASPDMMLPPTKKRGLQAEINKIDSVRKTIINNNIDKMELLRFRTELQKLVSATNELISG